MKIETLNRFVVDALRTGIIEPPLAAEIVRCVAAQHPHHKLPVNVTKLLHRHRKRPGRRRDPERDKRMVDAVAWVRFNRRGMGLEEAISQAAKRFKLTPNSLRHAIEGRSRKFRAMVRRIQF